MRLARSSLLLASVTLAASSCLLTSEPDFSVHQTRPEIVKTPDCQPEPSLATIRELTFSSAGHYAQMLFAACVLSDDADEAVQSALLFDYGEPLDPADPNSDPYQFALGGPDLDAARLDDGPRRLSIPWTPNPDVLPDDLARNCHTVTLIVSHRFTHQLGRYYCPQNPADSSTLTWFVTLCGAPGEACAPTGCPTSHKSGDVTPVYCPGSVPP